MLRFDGTRRRVRIARWWRLRLLACVLPASSVLAQTTTDTSGFAPLTIPPESRGVCAVSQSRIGPTLTFEIDDIMHGHDRHITLGKDSTTQRTVYVELVSGVSDGVAVFESFGVRVDTSGAVAGFKQRMAGTVGAKPAIMTELMKPADLAKIPALVAWMRRRCATAAGPQPVR